MENRQVPSDANGVYSLPSGYEAVTGETIQASQHNPPLEDLESAMSQRLMRTGAAPMTGPLKISDGSVGSPAVQFNSNSSTGFYKTTNGIGVSVNGTKVAEFTSSGTSRMLGELIPYTGLTAQTGCVLPYGQTLSRATYADLWAFAQTEIAGGNAFYNNGDGSTTFGVGDMRGRVVAGKDDMGGSSAGRLTPPASGGVADSTVLGSVGGVKDHTLTTAQLASHSHTGTTGNNNQSLVHTHAETGGGTIAGLAQAGVDINVYLPQSVATGASPALTHDHNITTATSGSGLAHNNVQPTLICNYLLYAGA